MGLFEEVVRFHLLSEHELCEEEASSERRARASCCDLLSGGWCVLLALHCMCDAPLPPT